MAPTSTRFRFSASSPLGPFMRFLLHFDVFAGKNEFVVGLLDPGHDAHDLQAQALFRNFTLFLKTLIWYV